MMRKVAAALAVVALTGFAGSALAEGDAEAGAKVFRKCKAGARRHRRPTRLI